MQLTLKGLVIKENSFGESNKVITVLSNTHGVIRCFAHGAKSIKNKKSAGTSLLSYSEFALTKTKDTYRVDEANVIDMFFNLRNDIESMSLAQYFCEMFGALAPTEGDSEDFLRLILNSLSFLCNKKRDIYLIKAATELRIAVLCGYMPDLIACSECAAFENEIMYFNLSEGLLFCPECRQTDYQNIVLTKSLLTAMRHITYCDFSKLYNFDMSESSLKELSMKVARERELLEKDGQDITLKILSERLCVPEEEIAEAIAASRSVMSLTYKGDDGICELDLPSASYENEICSKLLINEAILSLNEEEQEIIKLRFYAEKTQTESAKILGISQVQVSRKEKKALAKLRVFMK